MIRRYFRCISYGVFAAATSLAFAVEVTYPDADTIRFATPENSAGYYILEESFDLVDFPGIDIDLGANAPIWDVMIDPVVTPMAFYRVRSASVFTPLDTDGDGIDDIYELLRPGILDPLDPSDADLDPDGNGLNHLQEYLRAILDIETAPQYYSRELTSFNFGAPVDAALSREYTAFNFGAPTARLEAFSAEVSIYNGSGPQPYDGIQLSLSREWTVFNLGAPTAAVEAFSKEVSIYNGSGPPLYADLPQTYSRELTVFNLGAPTAPIEAISREVSVNALAESIPN